MRHTIGEIASETSNRRTHNGLCGGDRRHLRSSRCNGDGDVVGASDFA